jgi:hypothetical protein
MKPITGHASAALHADVEASIEADFWSELAQIKAESIGWHALSDGAYLHIGSDQAVIEVTGQATAAMAFTNVLWLV